jgi:hypothetical protein
MSYRQIQKQLSVYVYFIFFIISFISSVSPEVVISLGTSPAVNGYLEKYQPPLNKEASLILLLIVKEVESINRASNLTELTLNNNSLNSL